MMYESGTSTALDEERMGAALLWMVLGITGDATVNNGSSERLRTPFMVTEWKVGCFQRERDCKERQIYRWRDGKMDGWMG